MEMTVTVESERKTMNTAMKLETSTPEFLAAKFDTGEARKELRVVRSRFEWMVSTNADHAEEVEKKSRKGNPMLTNGQVHRRGTGSGFEVIYKRCRCDGFSEECTHDPRDAPCSEAQLTAAEADIGKAEARLAAAETRLASIEPSFDCLAAAREMGALYVWWPQDQNHDPRKYRYRGQPVLDTDVVAADPPELRRMLDAGAIVEVS
jgi:hypothetical protein